MELIALLSVGQGTWAQVAGVIQRAEWDNIILIGNNFARKFTAQKNFEFIEIKETSIIALRNEILEKLKGKIKGTEVALTIASGEGREHMALISALLNLPVGIRFTALTKEGVVFL